jgi:hypothetical protein
MMIVDYKLIDEVHCNMMTRFKHIPVNIAHMIIMTVPVINPASLMAYGCITYAWNQLVDQQKS